MHYFILYSPQSVQQLRVFVFIYGFLQEIFLWILSMPVKKLYLCKKLGALSYYDHFLSVIPNNVLQPFLTGNVLSVMLIAAAVGLALAFMPKTENREQLLKVINGLQELSFTLIRALLYVLPIGIIAFAGQLSAQIEAGVIVGALGKYTAVVIGGNAIQFFIILPLIMLIRGLNPLKVFRKMAPALAVALFTKSSAGTLPVTLACAEQNLKANPKSFSFRLTNLYNYQYEWLCCIYLSNLFICNAKCWF